MGALKILQPKSHFLSKILKNPKGGPFCVKKFFVSNFAQISFVDSLGPKDVSFQVSLKSETHFFFTQKGPPFGFFSI